jgi:hypothetical protein
MAFGPTAFFSTETPKNRDVGDDASEAVQKSTNAIFRPFFKYTAQLQVAEPPQGLYPTVTFLLK